MGLIHTRNISRYIDEYGMIVQLDGDGGDSFHRMNMYDVGYKKREQLNISNKHWPSIDMEKTLNKLECPNSKGLYRRHPKPKIWYSDCDRLSRDQTIPFIYASGLSGRYKRLFKFMIRHIFRLGFMTNVRNNHSMPGDENYKWKIPDWCGPRIFNMYIRAFLTERPKLAIFLMPILMLGDLQNFINSLIKVFIYGKKSNHSDDLNHILILMQAKETAPTPLSWLARKIYAKYRPSPAPPKGGYSSDFAPQQCLDHYFRLEKDGPPINDLFRPILKKILCD